MRTLDLEIRHAGHVDVCSARSHFLSNVTEHPCVYDARHLRCQHVKDAVRSSDMQSPLLNSREASQGKVTTMSQSALNNERSKEEQTRWRGERWIVIKGKEVL